MNVRCHEDDNYLTELLLVIIIEVIKRIVEVGTISRIVTLSLSLADCELNKSN